MKKTTNFASEKLCPCCSGKQYGVGWEPFHQGKKPHTALELMRSRFTAYALCMPEYIIHTTHPANPQFSHNTSLWSKQISEFSLQTQFLGLEILKHQEKGVVATVTFRAHLTQNNRDVSFTEKSRFEKCNDQWLYYHGQLA